ncbi:MAG: hypothetical protein ACRDYA_19490, partial [Egibacteraceae bacterium]
IVGQPVRVTHHPPWPPGHTRPPARSPPAPRPATRLVVQETRKKFPDLPEAEAKFEEVTGVLRADVFALLYTIVLALVIADVSGNFAAASSTVSAEATAVARLAHSANVFPADAKDAINASARDYVYAVVEDEWPSMRTGQQSPRAAAALDGLYAVYQSLNPQTTVEQAFYGASVNDLGEVTLERRQRLLQSQERLSSLLRVLLLVGAVVFVVLGYPASVRSLFGQLAIVGATAAFVSFAYLLTMVLDYPFAGDVSVDTAPFKQGALARYWAYEGPPRQLDPEMVGRLSPEDLVGVWNSDSAFGVMVFRQVDGEIRATYRNSGGTVVGRIADDGVLRGWWCQEPTRMPLNNAGEVEWRLLETPDDGQSRVLDGRWKYGAEEAFRGGWNLTWIGGSEPPDLTTQFDNPSTFCRHP